MARLRREFISPDPSRSFRLLLTPHLEDVFLWHYHPEYEIVYIEGTDGNRHIGEDGTAQAHRQPQGKAGRSGGG